MDLEDEEAVEIRVEGVVPTAHEAVGAIEKGREPRLQLLLMAAPLGRLSQRSRGSGASPFPNFLGLRVLLKNALRLEKLKSKMKKLKTTKVF